MLLTVLRPSGEQDNMKTGRWHVLCHMHKADLVFGAHVLIGYECCLLLGLQF